MRPDQPALDSERTLATMAPRLSVHPTPNTRLTTMAPSGFQNVVLIFSIVGIRKSYGTNPARAPCHVHSSFGRRNSLITAAITKTAASTFKGFMPSARLRFVSLASATFRIGQG